MTNQNNSSTITQYCNCYLLRNHNIIKDDLWVRDGVILDPKIIFFDEKTSADIQIDCHGAIISPGFIDVQCNDLLKRVPEVTRQLLPHGVTSLCPTVITLPRQHYAKIIPQIQRKPGGPDGTGILGLHLEGPFINPEKKGAHPAEHILQPVNGISDLFSIYGNIDHAAIVTIAPEIPGSMEIIRELTSKGIVVSLARQQ
ncbi:hypothetical protein LSH36_3g27002 [Paralvinella palmiformis]|uniref:N-acetylglucosamine-6-phosphate deacetylase n=1 Tax=Paralvinella palmiformis TaxID=53620 RepID=A0AAD9KF15_9ANNE|nr:hypothetical protein LSH36_3g27002 [Paralvinella palmiformis]